jgi:hypothetical protein
MKTIILGGSGLLGTMLARSLQAQGREVVVVSRRTAAEGPWRVVAWDGESLGEWAREFEGADAVINLAGRSVNCRFTPENRRQVMDSRTESTRVVGEALARAARPPRVWLQAATATIYAHRFDAANDETTGLLDSGGSEFPDTWRFSTEVAKSWERAINEAETPRTRKVILRISIVMTPERGGAFDTLLGLVRWGLGGRNGSGRQYVSWIHGEDFTRAVVWLLEREDLSGPVNLAAPNPLPNAEFMRGLRAAWGQRIGLPATEWMIEIGTRLMRTESELVLKSRRVVPGRLLAGGFAFNFPTWPEAAKDLCRRWREQQGDG